MDEVPAEAIITASWLVVGSLALGAAMAAAYCARILRRWKRQDE